VLGVNGEIYNHRELRRRCPDYDFQTGSDCEVILALYRSTVRTFCTSSTASMPSCCGMRQVGRYLIARDPIGVMPLYYGRDDEAYCGSPRK
jgi:asparagine synthase (glutamine-hydrolysing)